ncbi:MAG: putative drug exporter of the superfamily [Frankiales bacterium]|jgi:RND superfamily putative drug exporter|nr:putative drug exporter of the superfamily [Frankiales bacterium]
MRRLGEFVLRHKALVVVFWVVILVAGVVASGKATKRLTIDFSLPGQPGQKAVDQIQAEFGTSDKLYNPIVLTVTLPEGVAGHEAEVHKTFLAAGTTMVDGKTPRLVRIIEDTNNASHAFRTKDGKTAWAIAYYFQPPTPNGTLPTKDFQAAMDKVKPSGATAGVTGYDVLAIGEDSTGGPGVLVEVLLGALGALAVLVFVFASFLALLPLVIAAVSIMATFLMLLPLTYLTDVSFIVQFLVALIGLGVAIDYSLLLVTRWREERDHGRDNHDAVVVAMETAGHAVLFSGVTVAIGLVALLVLPVPFMRSMGMAGALIPLASVLTTLTLAPAILGSIGPKVDWPKIRHETTASRPWTRWAAGVTRRPWLAAGSAMALLLLLFSAFLGVKIGLAQSDSLTTTGAGYNTFHHLTDNGVPTGVLTPIEVIAQSDKADSVARAVGSVPGIAFAQVTDNTKNGHTIILAIPEKETVNSQTIKPVRNLISTTKGVDGVVGVSGIGPTQIDFLHAVYGNFPLMLALIALLTFVLLARAFRSLLLPFKAVILNLLSLAATYGAITLFWQYGYGSQPIFGIHKTGAITFWIPLMVFAFLYGLSMDYEVFILARIREEYDAAASTKSAVIEGIGRTGRLVTSAALILFLSFVALATGPGTDLKTLATALGIGILIDATIVRSLLVPALVTLFGRWNWYLPAWAARILRVEPSIPHEEVDRPGDPVPVNV